MPTISAHVPEDWEFADAFSTKVRARYDGKPGRYIKEAIERDLAGTFTPTSEDTLVALARVFHPTLVPFFEKQKIDNPGRVIAKLLEALVEGLDQREFKIEKPFHLSNYTAIQNAAAAREAIELMLTAAVGGDVEEAKRISARVYRDSAPSAPRAAEASQPKGPSTAKDTAAALTEGSAARPALRPHK